MITEETVFILGAGASAPYGYPTGKELRRQICKDFAADLGSINYELTHFKNRSNKRILSEIREFTNAFEKSSISSIDLFLSMNSFFSYIGKIAIVLNIIKAEIASTFRLDVAENKDWYSFLYKKMTDEITGSDDYYKFKENRVSFITFNYDRSLEDFLYESLYHSFYSQRNKIELSELLSNIPILHVYGKLADLPWQSDRGLEYKMSRLMNNLEEMTNNIRIIYDTQQEDYREIKVKIRRAKRIFFLGFGFAKENMDILGIPLILKHEPEIFGTAFNWTEKEIWNIKKYLISDFEIKTYIPDIENLNCYDLLREHL